MLHKYVLLNCFSCIHILEIIKYAKQVVLLHFFFSLWRRNLFILMFQIPRLLFIRIKVYYSAHCPVFGWLATSTHQNCRLDNIDWNSKFDESGRFFLNLGCPKFAMFDFRMAALFFYEKWFILWYCWIISCFLYNLIIKMVWTISIIESTISVNGGSSQRKPWQ